MALLTAINSCANPTLYYILMPTYRKSIKKTLCQVLVRRVQPQSTTTIKMSRVTQTSQQQTAMLAVPSVNIGTTGMRTK